MKIYLLTQELLKGYGTFWGCVVTANNEYEAVRMHPCGGTNANEFTTLAHWSWPGLDRLDDINVKLIGEAIAGTKPGLISASISES